MQASKSPHFLALLQLQSLLQSPGHQPVPESLHLCSLDQLYLSIIHSEYESALVRDILVWLLGRVRNPEWERGRVGGAGHYLGVGGLRDWLLGVYWFGVAVQEYRLMGDRLGEVGWFQGVRRFCDLGLEARFALLGTLVRNVLRNLSRNKSKAKEAYDSEQQEHKSTVEETKKKVAPMAQILFLGEDSKFLYCFAPSLPEYMIAFREKDWHLLDKQAVDKVIKKILLQPKSTNNLFLLEHMTTVVKKYMTDVPEIQPIIRIPRIKDSYEQNQKIRVRDLKQRLIQINNRYSIYLDNFNQKRWGFFHDRLSYQSALKKAQTVPELIQAFRIFYQSSRQYLFTCLCSDQSAVPQEQASQFYKAQLKYYCNINTVSNKLGKDEVYTSGSVAERMLEDGRVDAPALMEVVVELLEMAMLHLEKKAKKYYDRVRAESLKQPSIRHSQSSFQLVVQGQDSNKRQPKKLGLNLRQRKISYSKIPSQCLNNKPNKSKYNTRDKPKTKKRYGVCTLDSDESSYSQQSQIESNSNYKSKSGLEQYEFKTRSRANLSNSRGRK